MSNVLTAGRINSLEDRLDEATKGLVIDLGFSRATTAILDNEDELHEIIFDAEALCEEQSLLPNYKTVDIRTLTAIAVNATYLIDCSLEVGENPHG